MESRALAEEEAIGKRYELLRRWRERLLRRSLTYLVIVPTVLSALYFGLWATPRFESQADFVVRGVTNQRLTGLEALFRAFGVVRSQDDSNAVQNYILSRDALQALEAKLPLREIYGPADADIFSRFPRFWLGSSFERLYWYYLGHVSVVPDSDTGIIKLRAEAFRAADAQAIVKELISLSEKMVNKMNERLEADTVRSAEAAVTTATAAVVAAQRDITLFRNEQLVVDPKKNSAALLETITSLSADLDRTMAQIVAAGTTSPSNPQIVGLRAKADGLASRIIVERAKLAGADKTLADKVSQYEHLTLLKTLADKNLVSAVASLESARADVRRQHIYIEQVVSPNLPDEAMLPRRFRAVITTFVVCVSLAAMIWLVSVGVKEYRA